MLHKFNFFEKKTEKDLFYVWVNASPDILFRQANAETVELTLKKRILIIYGKY